MGTNYVIEFLDEEFYEKYGIKIIPYFDFDGDKKIHYKREDKKDFTDEQIKFIEGYEIGYFNAIRALFLQ